jgi:hypothetical protein
VAAAAARASVQELDFDIAECLDDPVFVGLDERVRRKIGKLTAEQKNTIKQELFKSNGWTLNSMTS